MEKCRPLSIPPMRIWLGVEIGAQRMYLFENAMIRETFTISTAKRGPSCIEDSLGTPWGLHRIVEKIGEGEPRGMVFKGRKPTGLCYQQYDEAANRENLITTRILRLRGLEHGLNAGGNCDSWDRYIYIHGTNHEEKIGSPASSGCVQLSNADMLKLFKLVPEDTLVLIEKDPLPST